MSSATTPAPFWAPPATFAEHMHREHQRRKAEQRALAVAFLADLVRINSVNGPGAEREVVDRVAAEARKLKLYAKEYAAPGHEDRPNLLVTLDPQPDDPADVKPLLFLFVAHADTVPVGDRGRWAHDPLGGVVEGDKLYGRGACDNKGGIALALYFLKRLKRAKQYLVKFGAVALAVVADEESGANSPIGLRYLLSKGAIRPRPGAGVAGGAIYTYPGWTVTIGHRGVLRLRIDVTGESLHTGSSDWSRGRRGHNAVAALCAIVCRLEQEAWPSDLHPAFPFLPVTVTPGTLISGGTAESVVPAAASCAVDVRLPPESEEGEENRSSLKERVLGRIREIVAEVVAERDARSGPARLAASVTVTVDIPPYVLPGGKDHPLAKACAAAVETRTGAPPPEIRGAGPANEGWMLHEAGIPVICGLGPLGNNFHAANESVEVGESFTRTMVIYEWVVVRALSEAEANSYKQTTTS